MTTSVTLCLVKTQVGTQLYRLVQIECGLKITQLYNSFSYIWQENPKFCFYHDLFVIRI